MCSGREAPPQSASEPRRTVEVPNLPAHIGLAREAADRIASPAIADNMGYFLLGSTAPDMRAITKRPREDYHFAPLDFERVGDGARAMLEAHPHLTGLDGSKAAFVAGYISHIVLDECWITEIFRPCFGAADASGDARGLVMDRALQLELDRRSNGLGASLDMMKDAATPLDLGFVTEEEVTQWRSWVVEFLARDFSWERLRFMARRIARGDEAHPAHAVADELLRSTPESLETMFEVVSRDELQEFARRSVDTMCEHLEAYLE